MLGYDILDFRSAERGFRKHISLRDSLGLADALDDRVQSGLNVVDWVVEREERYHLA